MVKKVSNFIRPYIFKLSLKNLMYNAILLVLAIFILFLIFLIKSKTTPEFYLNPVLYSYTIFVTIFQLSRIVVSLFYKHSLEIVTRDYNTNDYEPFVTFVVPCKNEEAAIKNTLMKCFEADYPKEKLEVIVINDGSTDNTLKVIKSVKSIHPELIVVNWKINKGKREGMAEGFRRAKGEIVIQLDSDSYIEPATFKNLINPFVNPEISAVCAHADPENADENLLTRMQASYYFMSFRIMKAAESTFFTVFCCSGCSSAYRRDAVMPILDKWLNEMFLGSRVTYGDDRALTSRLLKAEHKTIYTDKVQAYTIVPSTRKQLFRQQLRWKKSWIINAFFVSSYIFKREPFVAVFYFFPLIFISILTPFVGFWGLILSPLIYWKTPVYYFIGLFLITSIFIIYYRAIKKENKYWKYLYLWQLLNTFFFSYIIIYAAFKIKDRGWGTR